MAELNILRQKILIEDKSYSSEDFNSEKEIAFFTKSDFLKDLYLFLKDWFSEKETIEVKTSGSTGTPKKMIVEKSRMIESAIMTCSFLGLKAGDNTLLCLPLQYIAGKMIVVRALVYGLNLYPITPTGNPLKDISVDFDFAAMIPLQVHNSLLVDTEREKLKRIKNLIIGGGAIDPEIEKQIKDFPNKLYSTYGMTETLSHIALRKLNGNEATDSYKLLHGIDISISKESTLIIKAPKICTEILYTNDIAEINKDGSFIILGRKDNVINSGGIKIQIEKIESAIKPFLKDYIFAVTSIPDVKFGEQIVLVCEQSFDKSHLQKLSPSYYIPKKILTNQKIPLTETNKIDRYKLKKIAKAYFLIKKSQ